MGIAAARRERVQANTIRLAHVQGLTIQRCLHHTVPGGASHVHHVPEVSAGVQERATALGEAGHAVFQHGLQLGARHVHHGQGVGEGLHGDGRAKGDVAGLVACAHPAAVHKGGHHAVHLGGVEHGVGDEVAHGTLTRAAGALRDGFFRRRNRLGHHLFDRHAEGLHHRGDDRVFGHGGVNQARGARVRLHHAVFVKRHFQAAEHLAPLPGLHHQQGVAVHILELRGVFALGLAGARQGILELAERGVAVAAHNHVHIPELRPVGHVHLVGAVAEQDDLVDAARRKGFGFFVHALHPVLHDDGFGHGANGGQVRGRRPDDANALTAHFGHHARADQVLQVRVARHIQVGGEQRELKLLGKLGQRRRAAVEFVVAHGHGRVADVVHDRRVGQAAVDVKVQRALEHVPGIQQEGVFGRTEFFLDGGGQAGVAAVLLAADDHRFHAGVEVVGVNDRQLVIRGQAKRSQGHPYGRRDPSRTEHAVWLPENRGQTYRLRGHSARES